MEDSLNPRALTGGYVNKGKSPPLHLLSISRNRNKAMFTELLGIPVMVGVVTLKFNELP